MATRHIVTELAAAFGDAETSITFEAGGGVDIANRVRDGAVADVLVLSADAMAALDAAGLLVPGSLRALWVSQVVAAVADADPLPPFATVDDLRALLTAAAHVGYSTGPSGTALIALIDRLGLSDTVGARLVQAPPGVPVGTLITDGRADVAVQQRAELMNLPGVTILGGLPGDAAIN
jgi:molybdate transport system substrate-binding protein